MRSPILARAMVERFIDARLRDAIVGDLEEIFSSERSLHPIRARLNYWSRALGLVWRLGLRRSPHASQPTHPPLRGDKVIAMFARDIRHGARLFIKQPAFALAAVVTLGLAIGANTLIFTMANVLVLKPLPLRDPDRLGWIFATGPNVITWRGPISLPEYATYRDGVTAYTSLSAYQRRTLTMNADGNAERVVAHVVIGDLHGLWGLRAISGRTLAIGDERSDANRVAVLSHRFWTTRFASGEVIGRHVRLDGEDRVVVGILSPDIELGNHSEIDVWVPYQGDPTLAARTDQSWRGVGRLANGATIETANAQVQAIAARMASEHADTDRDRSARVGPTRDALGAPNTWVVLSMLLTVVGLLLLLACANVMNLLIARLIARRGELAVRTALGGTRGRIMRQIVAEGLVLGIAGGVLGLAIAAAGLQAIRAVAYEPFFRQLAIDFRVIGFAIVLALMAPIVFSLLPARRMLRLDAAAALNETTMRSVANRSTARGQSALVVVQVTLAVTLLVVATLVVRSMQAMNNTEVGYRTAGLLSTHIEIPTWKVADDGEALRLRQELLRRAAALTGAQGATSATELPGLQLGDTVTFAVGSQAPDESGRPSAELTVASADYFSVMGIPMLRGRAFAAQDEANPAPVAVISRAAAQKYWGDESRALGAQIVLDSASTKPAATAAVIGISADVSLIGFELAPRPHIYMLDVHRPTRSFYLLVRAASPETLAADLRATVRRVDPDLSTYQLRTVDEAFTEEASSNVLLSGMFAAFAIVALLLATGGLYGVMSYAVSQRSSEIAIRMSLGASPREVASNILRRSLSLAGIGVAIGIVAAFALALAMRSTLYGIGPGDPATYLAVVAVTGFSALTASWIPMRRAARVDPIQGLRQI